MHWSGEMSKEVVEEVTDETAQGPGKDLKVCLQKD